MTAAGCSLLTTSTPTQEPPTTTPASTPEPSPTPSATPVGGESPPAAGITRNYTWEYGGREWSTGLQIAGELYYFYKEIPRLPTTNYSVYVTHPRDDLIIGTLADEFRGIAGRYGFSETEQVELAAAFVQSLPYTEDTVTTAWDEYPRYPIETLVDNGGDCEDTSILLASILHSLGYDVVLLIFPDEHAAVGVAMAGGYGASFEHAGTDYFYLETTSPGWGIGDVPEEFGGLSALVYEMEPVPILTHDWDGQITGQTAELEIMVSNLGTGAAYGVYILAGFDAGEDQLWNAEQSQPFDVGPEQSKTLTVTITAPPGEYTRIVVQIIYEGSAVDGSYSEWFDTTGY